MMNPQKISFIIANLRKEFRIIRLTIIFLCAGIGFCSGLTPAAYEMKSIQQQTKNISGVVVDNKGEALIGVNVFIKGTSNGSITDVDGKFSISQVSPNATLVVSYVGYVTQEFVVGNRSSFDIRLVEDSQALEEVVVVGYGVQKKETLTGAVTAIKAEDIVTTKTENLITNIQGKMPGLLIRQQTGEPGVFDNMISIRGFGEPLVIIDGVTRSQDGIKELAQLSPEDVENISILKDASAAIYGMNAANGAIIVTTKKGTSSKTQFSYTGMYGMKMPTGMELTMDAYNYMLMANEMQRNNGAGMYAAYDRELLEKYKNNVPGYSDYDWIDLTMYDMVPQQNHNLSVRGGTDKVRYFVSLGYTDDNGLLKSDIMYYKRYNFRSNVSADLTKDLKMNVEVSGRADKRQNKRDDFWATYKALVTSERGKNWHTMANENHYTVMAPENKNPIAFIDPDIDGYRRWETLNGQSQVELVYSAPFLKGLNLSALADYNIRQINESYLERGYKLYDYFSDQYQSTYGTDQYYNTINLYEKAYIRMMANYTGHWNAHTLTVMGAMEASRERLDMLRGQRRYMEVFTHDILNQGTATSATNQGYREYRRLAAYFGRVNYDYADKYLLEFVARYDGSYRYAPSKRWVFFPSASIGWRLSEEEFIKDNLPFINNLKLRASYGESGRDAGNAFQYIPGYTSNSARGYIFDEGVLTTGMYPPGVVNDNLSWVTSQLSNVGLDFDVLNGKLGGSFEFFQRKNTGILATRITTVPNFFGATFPSENINSDMNMGLELNLIHRGQIGKDFRYNVSANTTFSRTKRLHVERAAFTSQYDRWMNGNEDRLTGRSLIYTHDGQYTSLEEYETAPLLGVTSGNSRMLPGSFRIEDRNGDGVINASDQVFENWAYGGQGYVSGTGASSAVNPPLQYGFTLAGTYKSFDLNLLFQGAALYSVNFASNDIWGYGRYPTLHKKYFDRWHTTAIEDDPYDPATTWVPGKFAALRPWASGRPGTTDEMPIKLFRPMANYLRLKSVELGYTIPRSTLKKIKIDGIRFYINATNLFTFCNSELKNIDPEKQEKDWDANLTYPIMKAMNIGVNINF
jgi:TonB-linked SusC/RagA family outer membrane protein